MIVESHLGFGSGIEVSVWAEERLLFEFEVIVPSSSLALSFAPSLDSHLIIKFINEHWQSGHVLSRERKLFGYMFLEKNGRLNFALAIDQNSDELIAILG